MRTKIVWRPQALEDLIDIYTMIGLDSEAAAERIYTVLESRAHALAEFPHMGQRRIDVAPTARILVEGSYLLLYELHPDKDQGPVTSVEIVRIVHGHRELSALF